MNRIQLPYGYNHDATVPLPALTIWLLVATLIMLILFLFPTVELFKVPKPCTRNNKNELIRDWTVPSSPNK
jgi:hypothetical protein